MSTLNRIRVLNMLIKHETMTVADLNKDENLGITANEHHLRFLLEELEEGAYIEKLNGANPCTYTITDKGIAEGNRLKAV